MRNNIEITQKIFFPRRCFSCNLLRLQKQREMAAIRKRSTCDSILQYFIRSKYYSDGARGVKPTTKYLVRIQLKERFTRVARTFSRSITITWQIHGVFLFRTAATPFACPLASNSSTVTGRLILDPMRSNRSRQIERMRHRA